VPETPLSDAAIVWDAGEASSEAADRTTRLERNTSEMWSRPKLARTLVPLKRLLRMVRRFSESY
jgi:hypothetical protein